MTIPARETKTASVSASTAARIVCSPRHKDGQAFNQGLVTLAASTDVVYQNGAFPQDIIAGLIFGASQDLVVDSMEDYYYITEVSIRAIPATVQIGDIFKLTFALDGSPRTASFTATGATVANVATGLAAAVNALRDYDGKSFPVVASDGTTHVKLTARTPGRPVAAAASTTDGGGADTQTLTLEGHLTLDRAYTGAAGADKVFVIDAPSECVFSLFNAEAGGGQSALYKYVHAARIPDTENGTPLQAQYTNYDETVKATGIKLWTGAATAAIQVSVFSRNFRSP
jgi:hypothetical protein